MKYIIIINMNFALEITYKSNGVDIIKNIILMSKVDQFTLFEKEMLLFPNNCSIKTQQELPSSKNSYTQY